MPYTRTVTLTSLAMIAFAGNTLLCRVALKHTSIDAASFTLIRLISGAATLWLLARMRRGRFTGSGNWLSGFALSARAPLRSGGAYRKPSHHAYQFRLAADARF